MNTGHAEIIDSVGAIAMAEKLRMKPARVRMWKLRKCIPRSAWPEVVEAFPSLTLEKLKALEPA